MDKPISMRISSIGDFTRGGIKVMRQVLRPENAAVIYFESREDAQRFAQTVSFDFAQFKVEKVTKTVREATES